MVVERKLRENEHAHFTFVHSKYRSDDVQISDSAKFCRATATESESRQFAERNLQGHNFVLLLWII